MKILRFDGASRGNPGLGSCAAVIYDQGVIIKDTYKRLPGRVTNNQAEYMGLIAGLRMALSLNVLEIQVEGDSKLVIEQLFGSWQCKHPVLKKYYDTAKQLLQKFKFINGRWIPREHNKDADAYCNIALDKALSCGQDEWFKIPIEQKAQKDLTNYFQVSSITKFC